MTDAVTINYSWAYPTVNADADTWGTTLNNALIAADASLKTVDDKTTGKLAAASNLSDLASAGTARTNLGLGTASLAAATRVGLPLAAIQSFTTGHLAYYHSGDADGSLGDAGFSFSDVVRVSNNLNDVVASSARTNLGLGSIATHNVTISTGSPSGGSDGDIWLKYS